QVQVMTLGQGQRCADILAGHVLRGQVVPLVGKHLAAAEQLDLVIECPGAIRLGVAQQQFQGFVGIPAVQALMIAQAPRQHEVAHAANQP
ncbi:hypothetical protein NK293_23530, partial [Salmonella enterica]